MDLDQVVTCQNLLRGPSMIGYIRPRNVNPTLWTKKFLSKIPLKLLLKQKVKPISNRKEYISTLWFLDLLILFTNYPLLSGQTIKRHTYRRTSDTKGHHFSSVCQTPSY